MILEVSGLNFLMAAARCFH